MAILGSALAEIIETQQLTGLTFTGMVTIGKQAYSENGVLTLPDEFKFTTEYSSRVASAQKFGNEFLVTTDTRLQSYSQEDAERFVSEGVWEIVLVF